LLTPDRRSGEVPVYPLDHEEISNGDYKNVAPEGLLGVKDGHIPIADMSLYHAVSGKEPVKVNAISLGKRVKETLGRFEETRGDLRTRRHRQPQTFGEVLFGKFCLFPNELISFSLAIH
jgi:hypothetical protein